MQMIRDRLLRRWQSCFGVFIFCTDRVELVPEACLIATGQQTSSRRTAERSRHVAIRESNASGSDRVDVRCWNLVISLAAEFAITEIVSKQKDNVRRAQSSSGVGIVLRPKGYSRDGEDAGQHERFE